MFGFHLPHGHAAATPAALDPQALDRARLLLGCDRDAWRHDWAGWRVRFAHDEAQFGLRLRDVAQFIDESVLPRCAHQAASQEATLYLAAMDDVRLVFHGFGAMRQGCGSIAAIQSQPGLRQAEQAALLLAQAGLGAAGDAEALALPDLVWEVSGHGQARVATARVRGRRVEVRLGMLGGQEMWVLDVDGLAGCARFRQRQDAMSKMGVLAALRAGEARLRKG